MPDRQKAVKELPERFKRYFWDVSFDELSFATNSRFIAERILNYGNQEDIKWLLSNLDRDFLKAIVKSSRNLNVKTRNYWKLVLEL